MLGCVCVFFFFLICLFLWTFNIQKVRSGPFICDPYSWSKVQQRSENNLYNRRVSNPTHSSPICQEGQSERTFPIFAFSSRFFLFPDFWLIFRWWHSRPPVPPMATPLPTYTIYTTQRVWVLQIMVAISGISANTISKGRLYAAHIHEVR